MKVELKGGFIWNCPDCGAVNGCRAETLDLTIDEKRETMAQAEGCDIEDIVLTDEELENTNFNTNPEKVTCMNCDREYETEVSRIVDVL